MWDRVRMQKLAEEYWEEILRIAEDAEARVDAALRKLESVSGQMYDTIRTETKETGDELERFAREIYEDVREEAPRIKEEFKEMGRRMKKGFERLERELKE